MASVSTYLPLPGRAVARRAPTPAALDAVGTDHLDVDVETDRGRGGAPRPASPTPSPLLQRERGTRITLTVQVDGAARGHSPPTPPDARARQATAAGVAARVNLMVMNFSYAPAVVSRAPWVRVTVNRRGTRFPAGQTTMAGSRASATRGTRR